MQLMVITLNALTHAVDEDFLQRGQKIALQIRKRSQGGCFGY